MGIPLTLTVALTTGQHYRAACDSKSHTGFRLVPTSMTLNDLERRNSPYFAFFHGFRQIFRPIISQWLKIDL